MMKYSFLIILITILLSCEKPEMDEITPQPNIDSVYKSIKKIETKSDTIFLKIKFKKRKKQNKNEFSTSIAGPANAMKILNSPITKRKE
jgi:hypothetical protein